MADIKLSPALDKYDLASPPSRYSVFLPKFGKIDLVTITEDKIESLIARGCTYFKKKTASKPAAEKPTKD